MKDNEYGPGFKKAREAALARSNGVCQACGHFKATAAHHWQRRYSPDAEITPDHLTGLCDLCHEMITTLRKALSAAESNNRPEVVEVIEDADRLTERQKSYIEGLFRQGGYHFPDEGLVKIAETLFKRYSSDEQLEQNHSILLGAWRAEGKRRVTDLNKHEAAALIEMLKSGDWAVPVSSKACAPLQSSAPESAAPSESASVSTPAPRSTSSSTPVSYPAPRSRSASRPRKWRRRVIILVLIIVAVGLLAYSGEKTTLSILGDLKKALYSVIFR